MLHDPTYTHDAGRRPEVSWGRKRRKEIKTIGHIPLDGPGFVYVGVSPKGRVKIGMSCEPERRCANLGIELRHTTRVRPQVAKEVETAALQSLGHDQGDGEWLRRPDVNSAIGAVENAMRQLRKRFWVDPDLTEEEARRLRVRLAVDEMDEKTILSTPDRRKRGISIVAHRRVAGMRAVCGSRFG